MLTYAQAELAIAPWLAFLPGICITVTALGFTLLGEALREAMDPHPLADAGAATRFAVRAHAPAAGLRRRAPARPGCQHPRGTNRSTRVRRPRAGV